MRDLHGIDRALRTLAPVWDDIEEEFDRANRRFLELAAVDHDAIGRVLRSHLIIENFMTDYLENRFGIDAAEMRLSFSQKAQMLPKDGEAASVVRPGIIQMNKVRNKFGHRLDFDVHRNELSSVFSLLRTARRDQEFRDPIEAMEAFAAVACAFLSVTPDHLRDAFTEAFREVTGPREVA